MTDLGDICAYCARPVLIGTEKPEHVIPAALGASLVVDTVCDKCNEEAGRDVDQPFLADEWVHEHRSRGGRPDPRRKNSRPIRSRLLRGHTDEGDYVFLDDDGVPQMGSRIIDLGDGRIQLRAGSEAEAQRLQKRVEKRAAAEGKRARIDEVRHSSSQPKITAQFTLDAMVWRREAAKIGLAVGSLVRPQEWRTGPDAGLLREWFNGTDRSSDDGRAPGLVPSSVAGTPFEKLVTNEEHLLFFQPLNGATYLGVVLFGATQFWVPVDTKDAAVPGIAWKLDPDHPRADGTTSWDALLLEMLKKTIAEQERD